MAGSEDLQRFSNASSLSKNGNRTGSFSPPSEETLLTIFIFLVLLGLSIVAMNSLVIVLVHKNRFLRTTMNYSLVSLALSDLLSGLVAIPLITLCNYTHDNYVCTAMDLTSRFLCLSTILHLLSIALERYIFIVHKLNTEVVTPIIVYLLLSCIWLFSLAITLVQLVWIDVDAANLTKPGMAYTEMIYNAVFVFVLVFLPILFIIYSYVRIYIVLRKTNKTITKQENCIQSEIVKITRARFRQVKEKRALFVFIGMFFNYALGWFHYFIGGLNRDITDVGGSLMPPVPFWLDIVFLYARFLTSLINPLLYTFFKMDFKQAKQSFLRKICSRERAREQAEDTELQGWWKGLKRISFARSSQTTLTTTL
ncbi:predicted protein [Nematostella vectensis]|uniref:G-protein coupled receptors family 1 profile domain-containing protein n=1 Tax=Nematostella vectensis TaxID=45351 RepID=A7RSG5_NEMVE|nr:5-hydroxytryptamine receptor 1B [Nematostella vectensis]EDO45559.1 predicted protein [Nematostella vectensis]|eukprot:XP_001637622.1 predicted protein [Nematostella vectensis]